MPKLISGDRAPIRCHFLLQHARFVRGQPAAAIILRPVGHRPAAPRHRFQPLPLRIGLESPVAPAPAGVGFRPDRRSHFRRAVRFQPGAGFGAEDVEFGHDRPCLRLGVFTLSQRACAIGDGYWQTPLRPLRTMIPMPTAASIRGSRWPCRPFSRLAESAVRSRSSTCRPAVRSWIARTACRPGRR